MRSLSLSLCAIQIWTGKIRPTLRSPAFEQIVPRVRDAPPGLLHQGAGPGLPGVPISSDDEDLQDKKPRTKRGKEEDESPAKRREGAVTLGDIQRLLENQSQILQDHQTRQIQQAVAELRESTSAQMKTMRAEMNRHGDYIEQLRDQGDRLEARIEALEAKKQGDPWSVNPNQGGGGGEARKNVIVFGGWGADTHRDCLLPELRELLSKINAEDAFEDIFTTGPRRGNALGIVATKPEESDQSLKKRMITIVQAIRSAQMSSKSMESGKNLWAALSKTRPERLRSSHAGKLKRLILEIDESEKANVDVEWNAGSVWLRGNLIGSAVRPKPAGTTSTAGKTPGTWMDAGLLGRVLGCAESDLRERWEALIQN